MSSSYTAVRHFRPIHPSPVCVSSRVHVYYSVCYYLYLVSRPSNRQVHQPRKTSSFFLVAMVGWCTRRQATLWLKVWWCVLARANVLQCVLYLVIKRRIWRCRRVARSLTRKGVLNPGARSFEKHKPGGWQGRDDLLPRWEFILRKLARSRGGGRSGTRARKVKAFGLTWRWLTCTWKQLKTSIALDCGTRICSSFWVLSDTLWIHVFVDNCCSSLTEYDIFRSVVENAPAVGKQPNFWV